MAPPAGTLRVGRYFLALLALIAVLYVIVFFPGNRHQPKLGIDLVGGIRVVFKAQVPKGTPAPTPNQMTQARQILENRINTTGVTGATVVVQGSNQLVVEIPSGTATDVARLGKAAILNFRGLIAPGQPVVCGRPLPANPSPSTSPSASGTTAASSTPSTPASSAAKSTSASRAPNDAADRPLAKPLANKASSTSAAGSAKASASASGSVKASGSTAASGSAKASPSPSQTTVPCSADPITPLFKSDPTLKTKMPNAETCPSPAMPTVNGKTAPCRAFSTLSAKQQQEITAALQTFKCSAAQDEPDIADRYYIACDTTNTFAYLMGHVVVRGGEISSAAAQAPSTSGTSVSTDWTVALTLGSGGGDKWSSWTSKYHTTDTTTSPAADGSGAACTSTGAVPCSDFVGFTLDGAVLSLPRTEAVLGTQTSVSGNFDQTSATNLAQELNYGKLPVSFRVLESQSVSATLGSSQLRAALLAGGIGLLLVVVYSLLYYRALGLVTIASLLVSAALTYAMLVILAKQIGFTLDLAGIAGFIVALGITADSFVVFFERIKDEVHDGRSLRVAVPRAWVRARRTILSADTVSFLAAAILYYFAAADVRGFAFTLGMSTILDLVVVFLFTHPIVSALSRGRAFGSARFTGLSNVRAGGIAVVDPDDPQRRASRSGPTRAKRPTGTATSTSSVAVLDPATEPEDPATVADGALDSDSDTPSLATDAGTDVDTPRRRTTPQAGTAAERAARRRARLRGGTDDSTDDGTQGDGS